MKIMDYLKEHSLIHPGRTNQKMDKNQKAKQRKKMRKYWSMKDTTFDE